MKDLFHHRDTPTEKTVIQFNALEISVVAQFA